MAKNIVVCSDGTGNSAIKGRGTNVFKLFESIDLNGHRFDPELTPQVAIYDDGVGTESFKPVRMLGGAAGYGLSRNVRQLYKELCRIYDPGDRIFLFGFSRGAFTVRSLGGFILKCGILDVRKIADSAAFERRVREAYRVYRRGYRTALMQLFRGKPDAKETETFRRLHCHGDEKIAFIGVWDTVDAVGMPFHLADVINAALYRFKFPDYRLSPRVERAYHALALDDERHSFHPLLWDQTEAAGPQSERDGQVIEQVWFSGAHSNIGGGYPKQGMSLVALDWMMHHAGHAALRLLPSDRTYYQEHANVDDKLYDPRSGLGIFYRWKPRDVPALCRTNGVAPKVHLSAVERIAHGTDDYQPGNIPLDAQVIFTPCGDPQKDLAAEHRAREVEKVLNAARGAGASLLERVRWPMLCGRASYYVYLLTCLAVVVATASPRGERWVFGSEFFRNGGRLVGQLVTSPLSALMTIGRRLLADPQLLAWLTGGLLVSYLLSTYAGSRMRHEFSKFWFEHQQKLRDALKIARQAAQTDARVTEESRAA
jgi:uncharacterized protein (DUF2235 family)